MIYFKLMVPPLGTTTPGQMVTAPYLQGSCDISKKLSHHFLLHVPIATVHPYEESDRKVNQICIAILGHSYIAF
jgi:hypothetical protein